MTYLLQTPTLGQSLATPNDLAFSNCDLDCRSPLLACLSGPSSLSSSSISCWMLWFPALPPTPDPSVPTSLLGALTASRTCPGGIYGTDPRCAGLSLLHREVLETTASGSVLFSIHSAQHSARRDVRIQQTLVKGAKTRARTGTWNFVSKTAWAAGSSLWESQGGLGVL